MLGQTTTAAGMSLAEAATVAAYDEHGLQTVSDRSAQWMRYGMGRLAAHCPALAVDQVAPADVAAWLYSERRRDVSPVTLNSYLRAVKVTFSRLLKRGLIASNPASPVPFLKQPAQRPRAISYADYQRMRHYADCTRDVAILDTLWGSGCRLGGLLSMRVDRMERWTADDGRSCYSLLVVEKGDRPRLVYLGRGRDEGDGLAAWLEERPPVEDTALFLTRTKPWRPITGSTVEGIIRRMRLAAQIPSSRPSNAHSFRHAYAQRLLTEGVDLAAVSAWLGHADPTFTAKVYAVRSEPELRRMFFQQEVEQGGSW